MRKSRLVGKKVAVLGLGREGLDLVKYLKSQKAEVTVLDKNTAQDLGQNYKLAKKLGAGFSLGKDYMQGLAEFDMLFRSPGISLQTAELVSARRKKIEISSAIKLFCEHCPAQIIGITGTKGKSTTTSLIFHLLKSGKKRVFMAGNIGVSPLSLLGKLRATDIVVLELSSFQLEDMEISPDVAVILNVVPEHLDRHKTLKKYLSAKQNIYLHQKRGDWLVASRDYPVTKLAIKQAKGKVFSYSRRMILQKGLYLAGEQIIYRPLTAGKRQVIASLSDVKLLGEHNLENVLPAIAVAIICGVSVAKLALAISKFKALDHRLQPIREFNSVLFVDDSLGTTPEASGAAIKALAYRDTAIILGGVHKGGDIKVLAKIIKEYPVKLVALIGQSEDVFEKVLKKYAKGTKIKRFGKNFVKAVKESYLSVRVTGGAVVLSPGCASFDMFRDAYDRGEQFAKIVKGL